MASKRILIFSYGTRGDVEPLLALALGLGDAGHTVALATSTRFTSWIEDHGVSALPLPDDLLAIVDTPDGRAMMEGTTGLTDRLRAGWRLQKRTKSINIEMMHACWDAAKAFAPDLIIYHPKTFAAPHIAEKLAVPAAMVALQPLFVPTGAFPAVGKNHGFAAFNKLTYAAVTLAYRMYRAPLNRFRRETLGLAPVRSGADLLRPSGAGTIPVLHGISRHVVPPPDDWPDYALMTGYWWLPENPGYRPPEALDAFLSAGPPPLYAGFGSMTSADATALAGLLKEAFRKAGVRGIVSAGWAGLTTEPSDDVLLVPSVPHGWLFPKMAAVIHHGGAGTTSAGFRAGVPSIICPFIGDQPFWGRKSHDLGVGTAPLPRGSLTADSLAHAITTAMTDTSMRAKAAELGKKLRAEDGVRNAVAAIEAMASSAKDQKELSSELRGGYP